MLVLQGNMHMISSPACSASDSELALQSLPAALQSHSTGWILLSFHKIQRHVKEERCSAAQLGLLRVRAQAEAAIGAVTMMTL